MKYEKMQRKIELYEANQNWRNSEEFNDFLKSMVKEHFEPNHFGLRLSRAREAAHISQEELGRGIGMTGANISKIEDGKSGDKPRKSIGVKKLLYFCKRLNVTPEYLLGIVEEPTAHMISDSSEAMEIWKIRPESAAVIDPLYPDSEETAIAVKFIMKNLWSQNFLLLYDLFQLTERPAFYDTMLQVLQVSFLKTVKQPDLTEDIQGLPIDEKTDALCVKLVYNRLARRKASPDFIDPSDTVRHQNVYSTFVNSLMDLGRDNSTLLAEFVKIASLTEKDKLRALNMLDGFVSVPSARI